MTHGYNNACRNRSSSSNRTGFANFVRSILPPPPDQRRVILKEISNTRTGSELRGSHDQQQQENVGGSTHHQVVPQTVTYAKKRTEISALNTTLIGDYIATIFPEYQSKWLVQASGNATFDSVLQGIKQSLIMVDRTCVFVQLGGNQIRSADACNTFTNLLNVVVAIREVRKDSRIFVVGIFAKTYR